MNTLVEFEAKTLVDLFHKGDILSIHMFMDSMSMPFDVQDKLFNEISALKSPDHHLVAQLIESHGTSVLNEFLGF